MSAEATINDVVTMLDDGEMSDHQLTELCADVMLHAVEPVRNRYLREAILSLPPEELRAWARSVQAMNSDGCDGLARTIVTLAAAKEGEQRS